MKVIWLAALLAVVAEAAAEDFTFDTSQYEKKAYEFGGYVQASAEHLRLDPDAALYALNFPADRPGSFERYRGLVELTGLYRWKIVTANGLLHADARDDVFGRTADASFYELYVAARPSERLTLEAGKRGLRWGKGYAFSPVAFLERPKDVSDPELSREGFVVASAEYVQSFDGPLRTVAFTPVILPVIGDLNDDFGRGNAANLAARLYLLYRDTDVDLMLRAGEGRPLAVGLDFARNLATNFEVHGEMAWFHKREVRVLGVDNALVARGAQTVDLLLGLRYLTAGETTWIVEYYHNGAGYTTEEMKRFFDLARAASLDPALRAPAAAARQAGYGAPQPMRDYLYVGATQKEPFGALYWSASTTAIVNLHDPSALVIPGVVYTGIRNLELRGRLTLLTGGRNSDFGERQNDWLVELRARYYF